MYDDLIEVIMGVYIFATKVSRGSIWYYVKNNNAVKSILLLIFDIPDSNNHQSSIPLLIIILKEIHFLCFFLREIK